VLVSDGLGVVECVAVSLEVCVHVADRVRLRECVRFAEAVNDVIDVNVMDADQDPVLEYDTEPVGDEVCVTDFDGV